MKFSARKDNAMLFGVVDLPRYAFSPIFFDRRISAYRHLPQRANGRSAAAQVKHGCWADEELQLSS